MSTLRAFTMPKWGIEMVEGTIGGWNIREGDRVTQGQIVLSIETDKIVNDVQAESNTVFVRIVAAAGETLPVGALLAVTADETVPAAESVGRVCAEVVAPYPPGVPVLIPGEIITAELLDALADARAAGTRIAYAADPDLSTLQVVAAG